MTFFYAVSTPAACKISAYETQHISQHHSLILPPSQRPVILHSTAPLPTPAILHNHHTDHSLRESSLYNIVPSLFPRYKNRRPDPLLRHHLLTIVRRVGWWRRYLVRVVVSTYKCLCVQGCIRLRVSRLVANWWRFPHATSGSLLRQLPGSRPHSHDPRFDTRVTEDLPLLPGIGRVPIKLCC